MPARVKKSGTDPVHLCRAVTAVLKGLPELNDGRPIGTNRAAREFSRASRSAIQRFAARDDSNACFHKQLLAMDFDKLSADALQLECTQLFHMRCKRGRPTFLSASAEAGIVNHCVLMGERGCCLDTTMIKATALSVANANYPDHRITKKWLSEGVSPEWLRGFMQRHKQLLSYRYGEGLEGNRRNVKLADCLKTYDILETLGEEHGLDWDPMTGKKKLKR